MWYVDLKISYFFKVLQPKLLGQGMSGLPTFKKFPNLLPQNVSECTVCISDQTKFGVFPFSTWNFRMSPMF